MHLLGRDGRRAPPRWGPAGTARCEPDLGACRRSPPLLTPPRPFCCKGALRPPLLALVFFATRSSRVSASLSVVSRAMSKLIKCREEQ